jgi:hypothetical protein
MYIFRDLLVIEIPGAVITYDQFHVFIILSDYGVERMMNHMRILIDKDEDAHQRFIPHGSSFLGPLNRADICRGKSCDQVLEIHPNPFGFSYVAQPLNPCSFRSCRTSSAADLCPMATTISMFSRSCSGIAENPGGVTGIPQRVWPVLADLSR